LVRFRFFLKKQFLIWLLFFDKNQTEQKLITPILYQQNITREQYC
jgi:hypothetical protein